MRALRGLFCRKYRVMLLSSDEFHSDPGLQPQPDQLMTNLIFPIYRRAMARPEA